MKRSALITLSCAFAFVLTAQLRNADVYKYPEYAITKERRNIDFPNLKGYETLKTDMHIHTVFSDGSVWPTVRVDEAWAEGLDAIAITDHLEYSPNKDYVKPNVNDPYKIAKPLADWLGIMLIPAAEITRYKPTGHLNAFFLTDAEALKIEDPNKAVEEAYKQGAFVMINHPGWPNDTSTLFDQHRKWIKEGRVQGIEVYNQHEYYPKAIDWCKEMNLAVFGCTDIHGVSYYPFQYQQNEIVFRPMTLMFVKDRSLEGMKEAMFGRRTITYFNNKLAGNEALLDEFFQASYTVRPVKSASNEKEEAFHIQNTTSMPYDLCIDGNTWRLPAKSTVIHRVKKGTKTQKCEVRNLITGEFKYLNTELKLR